MHRDRFHSLTTANVIALAAKSANRPVTPYFSHIVPVRVTYGPRAGAYREQESAGYNYICGSARCYLSPVVYLHM